MYVTIDQFKSYAQSHNDDAENLAEIYVQAAHDVVTDFLGYNPESRAYKILVDGTAANSIPLGVLPVKTVLQIMVNGIEQSTERFAVRGQYLFCLSGTFPAGEANIYINFEAGYNLEEIPGIFKMTVLRIAGTLGAESDGNIGVSSKSFGETGSRTFLNSRFDRYLEPLEKYRVPLT